jgi:hypothetical protein
MTAARLPWLMTLLCSGTAAAVNLLLASGGFVSIGALAAGPGPKCEHGYRASVG